MKLSRLHSHQFSCYVSNKLIKMRSKVSGAFKGETHILSKHFYDRKIIFTMELLDDLTSIPSNNHACNQLSLLFLENYSKFESILRFDQKNHMPG